MCPLLSRLGPLQRIQFIVSDYYFKLRGQTELDTNLSLILVDPHTVKKYGFPFSRRYYAIVANALIAAGAKVVAFDYIFDQEQPQDPLGDEMLMTVTSASRKYHPQLECLPPERVCELGNFRIRHPFRPPRADL